MTHLWIPRKLTPLDKVRATLDPGRGRGKPAGGYVDDLVALRKVVLLCPFCIKGFSWKHKGYKKEDVFCTAKCDVCRTPTENAVAFVPEEFWHVKHPFDAPRPSRGRLGLANSNGRNGGFLRIAQKVFGKR